MFENLVLGRPSYPDTIGADGFGSKVRDNVVEIVDVALSPRTVVAGVNGLLSLAVSSILGL